MSVPKIKVGTYTGTGASLNISIGFIPSAVIIMNVTDGTPVVMWTENFADAASLDIAAAAASNAAGSVAPFAGTAGALASGFSTGADNSVSEKVYSYIAMRSE